jgi:hypothetical protein
MACAMRLTLPSGEGEPALSINALYKRIEKFHSQKNCIVKLLIFNDMEGATGVVEWNQIMGAQSEDARFVKFLN